LPKYERAGFTIDAGRRGLRAGSSLARLLSKHRSRRNHLDLPRLSNKKILAWADAISDVRGDGQPPMPGRLKMLRARRPWSITSIVFASSPAMPDIKGIMYGNWVRFFREACKA
jgi:hypothetical protein